MNKTTQQVIISLAASTIIIKCWKAEHKAIVKLNELDRRYALAKALDKPTKQIENSIKIWSERESIALDLVYKGITDGIYPRNTVEIIGVARFGALLGYVADCFDGTYDDFMGIA